MATCLAGICRCYTKIIHVDLSRSVVFNELVAYLAMSTATRNSEELHPVWVTADRRVIPVNELDTSHLHSLIRMIITRSVMFHVFSQLEIERKMGILGTDSVRTQGLLELLVRKGFYSIWEKSVKEFPILPILLAEYTQRISFRRVNKMITETVATMEVTSWFKIISYNEERDAINTIQYY